MMTAASRSFNLPRFTIASKRLPPLHSLSTKTNHSFLLLRSLTTYSVTIKKRLSSSKNSYIFTIFGWSMLERMLISLKSIYRWISLISFLRRTLKARYTPVSRSTQSLTSPKPPVPMTFPILYLARMQPSVRPMNAADDIFPVEKSAARGTIVVFTV